MTKHAPLIAASVLIAVSMLGETVGYFARVIGARERQNALGYSMHVLIATYSRVGTLLGLPIIGYALDVGVSPWRIALVALTTYAVFILVTALFYFDQKVLTAVCVKIFARYGEPCKESSHGGSAEAMCSVGLAPGESRKIIVASALAFFCTSVSFFIASSAAAVWTAYRVTMLQLTPMMTAVGTLVSVTYLDPGISKLLDGGRGGLDMFRAILVGRFLAAISGGLVTVIFVWGFRG